MTYGTRMNGCRARSTVVRAIDRLVLSLVAVALAGCGSNLSEVTGLVTLNGEPLRGGNGVRGTVYFQPATGEGTTAVGLLDENGEYSLSSGSQAGVAPGEYLVACSATQLIRTKDGNAAGGKRLTGAKYANALTSGLKFTVVPGKNQFDLELSAGPSTAGQNRGS